MVINIPGSGNVSQGTPKAKFNPSAPPAGTGLHRYLFLLYKQPRRLYGINNVVDIWDRASFNVTAFVEKHELGKPILATYYKTQTPE